MADIDEALAYAGKGYCVFPVHHMIGEDCSCKKWNCKQGKHPRITKWQDRATTNESQIKAWWTKWPASNIGIVTGVKSKLLVIDIDPRNGGDKSLQYLINAYDGFEPILNTYTVSTGGCGIHYYFVIDKPFKSTKKHGLGVGIDIQADNAYVIAPPSNHKSGGSYSIKNNIAAIHAPQILFDLIGQQKGIETNVDDVVEGDRNNWLANQAGQALRDGKSKGALKTYLQEQNVMSCKPPLDYMEVDGIADSIIKGFNPSASSVSTKTRWQEQIVESKEGAAFIAVNITLSLFMDKDGRNCFPNQHHIADRSGLNISTVSRQLAKSEELGFLIKYKHSIIGKRGFSYGYIAHAATDSRAQQIPP